VVVSRVFSVVVFFLKKMTLEVEGYHVGDLVWLVETVLWPVMISKKTIQSPTVKQDYQLDHPIHSKIHQRLDAFHQCRFIYQVIMLPVDSLPIDGGPSEEEEEKKVFDYELLPFYYTTKPTPTADAKYNRALIQAIQIASSWSVPETKIYREPLFDPSLITKPFVPPPIQNPIHIGCPSVSGVYLGGTVVQHMVEPRLIKQLKTKTTIIDLTSELLTQGISHWKHTSKSVQFHTPVTKKTLKQTMFPRLEGVACCRIGAQIVRLGDFIVLMDERVVIVEEIRLVKGSICVNGCPLNQIKARFDPCFDINKFGVLDQTTWDGHTIVPQLYVALK
jgi:hypothetical protein